MTSNITHKSLQTVVSKSMFWEDTKEYLGPCFTMHKTCNRWNVNGILGVQGRRADKAREGEISSGTTQTHHQILLPIFFLSSHILGFSYFGNCTRSQVPASPHWHHLLPKRPRIAMQRPFEQQLPTACPIIPSASFAPLTLTEVVKIWFWRLAHLHNVPVLVCTGYIQPEHGRASVRRW